jgi:hypothetical protein
MACFCFFYFCNQQFWPLIWCLQVVALLWIISTVGSWVNFLTALWIGKKALPWIPPVFLWVSIDCDSPILWFKWWICAWGMKYIIFLAGKYEMFLCSVYTMGCAFTKLWSC